MEIIQYVGKNNSKLFHVPEIDELFLIKEIKKNGKVYFKCYIKACKCSGRLQDERFEYINPVHTNHVGAVSARETLVYGKFINTVKHNKQNENGKTNFDNALVE
jgi:hypothetical protein